MRGSLALKRGWTEIKVAVFSRKQRKVIQPDRMCPEAVIKQKDVSSA
jgi:hypothetical protein